MLVLGHELNNVLHGLLGVTDLLRNSGLSAEQRLWLDVIARSGKQMHQLIESASSADSETGSDLVPQTARMDGIGLLEQVMIHHYPAARQRQNRLVLVVDPSLPRFWLGDQSLIQQVLDNLLGNAIKFTQAGEIVLTATVGQQGEEAGCVVLGVRDSGPGIPAAVSESIFEAYAKGGCSATLNPLSKGLGLFVCQRIARAMNASLEHSEPERGGARFEFVLPGGLDDENDRMQPRFSVLSHIHCQLQLESNMCLSVGNFLSRQGVNWTDDERPVLPGAADRLNIRVSHAEQTETDQSPALKLEPIADRLELPASILLEPVLQSRLAPQLIELALQWLSRGARRDSVPGLCRPGWTSGQDSLPE